MDSKKLFTEEELVKYYSCVMKDNKPFTKTYYLKVPEKLSNNFNKVPVVFRTTRNIEVDKVNDILANGEKSKRTDLVYSLVSFGEENYDRGDIQERLLRLDNLQTLKFNLILELYRDFEKLVDAMSKEVQTVSSEEVDLTMLLIMEILKLNLTENDDDADRLNIVIPSPRYKSHST